MIAEIKLPILDEILERIKILEDRINNYAAIFDKLNRPTKQWYSVKEAAEYLNVSPKTIYRLLERNLLKRSLATRHIKIPADSLRQFKETTTV